MIISRKLTNKVKHFYRLLLIFFMKKKTLEMALTNYRLRLIGIKSLHGIPIELKSDFADFFQQHEMRKLIIFYRYYLYE